MDEAGASSNPSPEDGHPVQLQTSAGDAASADFVSTSTALLTPPQDAEPLTSLLRQQILRYLATADNGVLLASLGALALLTYFILGRLGLLLMGVVSGFLLHEYRDITDYGAHQAGNRNILLLSRKKELGIEVASRLLDWTSEKAAIETDHVVEVAQIDNAAIALDASRLRPATAAALSELIDAIVRNYVSPWYRPILPFEDSFPRACRKVLVGFVNSLSTHMTRKRSADTFLQFVTNSSSMIIVFLNELSLALQATSPDASSTEHFVREYLKKYPDSNLANVLSIEQQQKKLKMVADDILFNFLDASAYQCEVVKTLLREILAGVVLESVVKSCSQPDFINGWIVYLLKEGEPEIMNAIDAGLESASKGEIAALSGIAGHASQDLAKAIPTNTTKKHGKRPSRAEQEAAALRSPFREEISLPNDISHQRDRTGSSTRNGSLSSTSTQGAISSPSAEQPSREVPEDTEETQQQQIESKSHEQGLRETRNTEQEAEDTAIHILYGASVVVDDGSIPGDKVTMKAKPTTEYMLQIEPASTRYPGWMIFRKYQDFERLHKALETLSRYHHVSFLEAHASLPSYRDHTKSSLAKALERYLRDALEYKELATSERLRRFLDKDNEMGQTPTTPPKTGLSVRASNTFENMGKGVLGVLSNAPKGVAGGGKAVLDGVSGVFGGVNRARKSVDITSTRMSVSDSNDTLNNVKGDQNTASSHDHSSQEKDSPPIIDQKVNESSTSIVDTPSVEASEQERTADESGEQQAMQTSPGSSAAPSIRKTSLEREETQSQQHSNDIVDSRETSDDSDMSTKERPDDNRASSNSPITEEETRVAVELIFAVINELYTLSSAWNIRKTLLNAAKAYVLRPRNNPHLESIRVLVQESMIDAHTADEAIAMHINKIRENSLPTEEELKSWPPPLSKDESEKLKNEAKQLLIERGMPQVLMSVMGAAASGEALGQVFDCLQVEEVGRGFMFALILQALRAVIL